MTGRHSLTREAALNTLNSPAGRGLAAAMAMGTMFGVALPSASADQNATAAKLAPTDLSTVADAETVGTESVTAPAEAEWNLEQVEATDAVGSVAASAAIEVDIERNAPEVAETAEAADEVQATAGIVAEPVAQEEATTAAAEEVSYASTGSGTGSSVLATALAYQGAPYRWGGTTPAGWDCIGFVRYVYAQYGVSIGGYTTSVLSAGRQVPYSDAQPGDILYWPGHVAIYAGNGQNIGAWNPSMGTAVGPNSWLGTPVVIRVFG